MAIQMLTNCCSRSCFTTLVLGAVFIVLGSSRVLIIKFSANDDGKYDYLPVTVNVCAELIKLIFCLLISLKVYFSERKKTEQHCCQSKHDVLQFMKWAVPGLLYFLDNLIAFYIIKYFQPAMVVLLWNFGIITTSVLFRLILKKKFTRVQWASLVIVFLSIMLLSNGSQSNIDHQKHHAVNHIVGDQKNIPEMKICTAHETHASRNTSVTDVQIVDLKHKQGKTGFRFHFHEGHLLVLLQCLISSLAGIYNEKIFKEGTGMEESIYIQNSKLYLFGVIFNSLSMIVHGVYRDKIFKCGFFYGHNIYSIILVFVTVAYGLTIAFIFKFRDNMFYLFSAQITTIVMVTSSIYFFKFQPGLDFFLTAPIVLVSIYIYHNSAKNETGTKSTRTFVVGTKEEMLPLSIDPDNEHE